MIQICRKDKEGEAMRRYKPVILRGVLDDSGIVEDAVKLAIVSGKWQKPPNLSAK